MIPRALALESTPLLKPLSCHAMAAASEPGAPWRAAIEPICVALRRAGVAAGGAAGAARPARARGAGGPGGAGGGGWGPAGGPRALLGPGVFYTLLGPANPPRPPRAAPP